MGTVVLAAATDVTNIARLAGVGSELYIKSYSREQEHQADHLGVRYLHRTGYDQMGMARFLQLLESHDRLKAW